MNTGNRERPHRAGVDMPPPLSELRRRTGFSAHVAATLFGINVQGAPTEDRQLDTAPSGSADHSPAA